MLNPVVLKCHEDLSTLDTYRYVQLGNTIGNKFFNCENSNIVGPFGGPGGGGGGWLQ